MPVNVNDPEYSKAEIWFHKAKTPEEQLLALDKMLAHAPKHKSSENLLANLRTRKKKLENQIEKQKKTGKSSKIGIKKDEMQCVLVGKTNSGKSSILHKLTNAAPKISENKFTTIKPEIGMMPYMTTSIQLIEIPGIDSEYYDKGIVYTADTVLLIVNTIEEINDLEKQIKTHGKKIIVFNKLDKLHENEKRKIEATLKSKYKNNPFILISTKTNENLEELKEKIFQSFNKLRVYTKEPGKKPNRNRPMILQPESTISDVAEKILKGFSSRIVQAKIWGPSSKFPGQIVGLKHKLKDLDIVEFKTR